MNNVKLKETAEKIKAIMDRSLEIHPIVETTAKPETTNAGLIKANTDQFKVGETTDVLYILKITVDKNIYDERLRESTATKMIDYIVSGLEIDDDQLVRQVGIDGYPDLTATLAQKESLKSFVTADKLI